MTGEAARDEGITRTLDANPHWATAANEFIKRHLAGAEVTGEDIRLRLQQEGIEPGHPNAWGGLVSTRARSGVLTDTGQTRKMKAQASHARRTPVWRVKQHGEKTHV